MQVSIIITAYNEEKYIEQCLISLKNQNINNYEILVVNDGSQDKTKAKAEKIKSEFKINNLRIFEQKHQGLAKARNLGAKKTKGKILVFLDADMYFGKNFLAKLIKPIISGKSKGVYSTLEYVANWHNVWARCWNYNWNLTDKKRIDTRRKDQKKEFRAILKTEFEKAGGLDSVGYTDAWTLPQKLGYGPTAVRAVYYHYNPANLKEVFFQARWAGKRKYKLGNFGAAVALIRANPIFSLINGIRKAIRWKEPAFVIFKLVYDSASSLGLLEKTLFNKKNA